MMSRKVLSAIVLLSLGFCGSAPAELKTYELFKVDLSCPTEASTFKDGWTRWRMPGGCDGDGHGSVILWNIADTRINATLNSVDEKGVANLQHGPGEPLANTRYQRVAGRGSLSIQLTLDGDGLVPGEYILYSYHNISRKRERNRGRHIYAIAATGPCVTQLSSACNVPIQTVINDNELVPAKIRFRTDGSGPVTITFLTGGNYSAVLNGFALYSVTPLVIAWEPNPPDGAKGILPNVKFTWKSGVGAGAHDFYISVDKDEVQKANRQQSAGDFAGTVTTNSFDAGELKCGMTYYWRVDEISKTDPNILIKGKTWSFTVIDGKAHKPSPFDMGINVPCDITLKWKPGYGAVTHKVYFGTSPLAAGADAKPVYVGKAASFKPPLLKKVTNYYWRVDEVHGKRTVTGTTWSFLTEGTFEMQVDLAVPKWGTNEPIPETAKPGWTIWAPRGLADLYSHDHIKLENAGGTGINIWLTLGNEGMGCLKAKGMRMYSMAGDGPPAGRPMGEPICNTWYEAADWASYAGKSSEWGNILLAFENLPPGEYKLYSYHNHFYHCDRYEDGCLGIIKYRGRFNQSAPEQGPMPSITARPLPPKALPGYEHWGMPKGTGKGVSAIRNAYNVTAQHVDEDYKLSPSLIQFRTDGSPVLVIYEAPKDYWDYREYPGGRAFLNAFRLERVVKK